jgi:hypothetical protein
VDWSQTKYAFADDPYDYEIEPEYVDVTTCGDVHEQKLLIGYRMIKRTGSLRCAYCNSRNEAGRNHCTQCGAAL